MKLLLDENLSRRIVPFLQTDFPGSSQVVLLKLESASDSETWQYAKDNGRRIFNWKRPSYNRQRMNRIYIGGLLFSGVIRVLVYV